MYANSHTTHKWVDQTTTTFTLIHILSLTPSLTLTTFKEPLNSIPFATARVQTGLSWPSRVATSCRESISHTCAKGIHLSKIRMIIAPLQKTTKEASSITRMSIYHPWALYSHIDHTIGRAAVERMTGEGKEAPRREQNEKNRKRACWLTCISCMPSKTLEFCI